MCVWVCVCVCDLLTLTGFSWIPYKLSMSTLSEFAIPLSMTLTLVQGHSGIKNETESKSLTGTLFKSNDTKERANFRRLAFV